MRKPSPIFTQFVLGTILIGGSYVLSQVHRASFDERSSQLFTAENSTAIAQTTIAAYRQAPFPISAHIRHYESVRDTEGRSPQTRRIFALGAERLTAINNRLTLIQGRVQTAANPTEFLSKNIDNQYVEALQELELWRRAEQHFAEQTMVEPLPQNPQSLLR